MLAIAGAVVLVARRLPGVKIEDEKKKSKTLNSFKRLKEKGIPIKLAKDSTKIVRQGANKVWSFMLEAKGLRHNSAIGHKLGKYEELLDEKNIVQNEKDVSTKQVVDMPSEKVKVSEKPIERAVKEKSKRTKVVEINEPEAENGKLAIPKVGTADEAYFLERIKKFPKKLEYYNRLGWYYLENKHYDDAKNVYEYLCDQDKSEPEFWARLGYIELMLADWRDAVKAYENSVALDSSYPNRYYNLALAYSEQNMFEKAGENLEKALDLDPKNEKYKTALTEQYLAMGKKR